MKAALVLFVLCAAFVSINALPAPEETGAKVSFPWYQTVSYEYMMCRMQCKQSCMDQGYWRGYCKDGECFCYGFMGPNFPRMKEAPAPLI